jgi:hypothetical protein
VLGLDDLLVLADGPVEAPEVHPVEFVAQVQPVIAATGRRR